MTSRSYACEGKHFTDPTAPDVVKYDLLHFGFRNSEHAGGEDNAYMYTYCIPLLDIEVTKHYAKWIQMAHKLGRSIDTHHMMR